MNWHNIELPSNKTFGFFFTIVFAIAAGYFFLYQIYFASKFCIATALVLLVVTVFKADLPFYDTYPSILSRLNQNWNVLNSGLAGVGIRSALASLKNNLECVNPSVVIMQVLANDIKKIAITEYNQYNFSGEILSIQEIEKEYLRSLK